MMYSISARYTLQRNGQYMKGSAMFGYILTDHSSASRKYLLTIDGVPVDQQKSFTLNIGEKLIAAAYIPELYDQIILFPFEELLKYFNEFSFIYPFSWEDEFENFYIDDIKISRSDDNIFKLIFSFSFDFDNWKQLWSMIEHGEEFKLVFDTKYVTDAECKLQEDYIINGFDISFNIKYPNISIQSELETILIIINKVHKQTLSNLSSKAQYKAVVVQFNFPNEVKVACEQYLLYFVQFLHDVGIEAIAELREEADSVLFSVTPSDKEEALENIKIALGVYLRLPSNPVLFPSIFLGTDIEVQWLVSNIYHLQGQLALASAVIQQKDALIQHQQSLIQQQLLSGQILIQSIQQDEEKEEDTEPLMGSIISVKKYDWEFLELDLPTMLRRLKQIFSRKSKGG